MQNSRDSSSTPDHLQLALEASSSALIGLQWILAQLLEAHWLPAEADDPAGLRGRTSQTIDALRQAITELRHARGDTTAQIALGFVIEAA